MPTFSNINDKIVISISILYLTKQAAESAYILFLRERDSTTDSARHLSVISNLGSANDK